jgi:site-specific DNA recombinase
MRVAIYARYSSDLQDVRSIADQVAVAHDYALRHEWQVVKEFSDAAILGSSLRNRPGLQDMLAAAEARDFDVVLTESLDRLSRDLEDIAALYKRLSFWGVKIMTLADGVVDKLHAGLKGIVASIYLDDLAQKTRRGQIGRVKEGRIPGGRCYGYDVVAGDENRGRRTINDREAAIVRRIFAEYVTGSSPLAIASRLNQGGVAAPRGGQWNASTINGSRKRANGIVSNSLYIGVIAYNRQTFVKDPTTGRRQARLNAQSEWRTGNVPELRIVDDEVWQLAQSRRREVSKLTLPRRNRPRHLLSGLLECGACGASYIVVSHAWLGCSAVRNKGTCNNRRMIQISEIESRVLAALQVHLLSREAVAVAVDTYLKERQRLATERAKNRNNLERDLSEVRRKIARLAEAIETGAGALELLVSRLKTLGMQEQELTSALSSAPKQSIVAVHPNATERYRQKVAEIGEALAKGDSASAEAITLVRDLIGKIVIEPAPGRSPLPLKILGDLAMLVSQEQEPNGIPAAVVAGVGFEPTTFRL